MLTKEHAVFALARMADCADPDGPDSAGTEFLTGIEVAVQEHYDYNPEATADSANDDGTIAEIADGAVPIYTHRLWSTFVDLAAWNEDPTELGVDGSDMEQGARVCLYMIAERLAAALFQERDEDSDDEGRG